MKNKKVHKKDIKRKPVGSDLEINKKPKKGPKPGNKVKYRHMSHWLEEEDEDFLFNSSAQEE